jgi:hypothetical protein
MLPTTDHPLKARGHGTYAVVHKVSGGVYVVKPAVQRNPIHLCYINMLKAYHDRNKSEQILVVVVKLKELVDKREDG